MDELKSATATLRSAPRVPGTAWAVDYRTNRVVVRADRTVSAGDWSRLTRIASGIGSFVHMEPDEGTRYHTAERRRADAVDGRSLARRGSASPTGSRTSS
ncbi:S1 family peptidase [Streptomyces tricolor]|nr:S1 family peptidase [Streptomyces tricolor]